ncbi:hypothetical protein [Deinococcus maricopensis]|uniref:Uncharacterized protein n=1 Tax=Deinococcus maricopensis (strain DSM 21211 / LMG 22137 / NRRL B-23946 / LB-34) TaxID=709986 RepID=E8U9Z1_DEIML|nr:hypothetical protein [Deinococcus maricopensis]ADV67880.1 hypothetical protein Deima_2242 [Deinococcus maricopensis DSM 21211]
MRTSRRRSRRRTHHRWLEVAGEVLLDGFEVVWFVLTLPLRLIGWVLHALLDSSP